MANRPDLSRVAAPEDQLKISSIQYLHDPVPSAPPYLSPCTFHFPCAATDRASTLGHGIALYPIDAGLPFRSSILAAFETLFWQDGLDASIKMIELLAADDNAADVAVRGGVTLRRLATHELRPGFEHRFNKATTYMYSATVSARRLRLIATMMVLQFIFDDKCEETEDNALPGFVGDFVARLYNSDAPCLQSSMAQDHIDEVIADIHRADHEKGDGGAAVLKTMRETFQAVRPSRPPASIGEYLLFRHENVSANFVLACIKFSLASSVNMDQPAIARFLHWAKDHLAITNDLYSYAKEARAYRDGSARDLVNIVAVVQNVLSLPNDTAALEMSYALLLQRESWMSSELNELAQEDRIDSETWEFLEAVWRCLAGNTFYSMTSSRYGGEEARIKETLDVSSTHNALDNSPLNAWPGLSAVTLQPIQSA